MIVIEVFARGCEARWRPMPTASDTSRARQPASAAAFPFRGAGSTPAAIPLGKTTPISQSIGRSYPSRRHRDSHCAFPGPLPHSIQVAWGQLRAHRHNRREKQIPIALATHPAPDFPRLRALALFGRRPPGQEALLVMPASKNQHATGRSEAAYSADAKKACQTEAAIATDIRENACLRWITQYGGLRPGSAGSAQKWNSSLSTAPIGQRHWKPVSCITAGPAPSRPSSGGAARSAPEEDRRAAERSVEQ